MGVYGCQYDKKSLFQTLQNSVSCFPLKSCYFRYVTFKMSANNANVNPGPPGMAHMAEMSQIFDISSKNMMSKKYVTNV